MHLLNLKQKKQQHNIGFPWTLKIINLKNIKKYKDCWSATLLSFLATPSTSTVTARVEVHPNPSWSWHDRPFKNNVWLDHSELKKTCRSLAESEFELLGWSAVKERGALDLYHKTKRGHHCKTEWSTRVVLSRLSGLHNLWGPTS